MHHVSNKTRFRQVGSGLIWLAFTPVLVLWGWNMAVPELFGAPEMDYRNALGVVLLGLLVTFVHRHRSAAAIRHAPNGGPR